MKPKIWSDRSYLSHKTEEWIHGQNGGKKTKFWGWGEAWNGYMDFLLQEKGAQNELLLKLFV